MLHELLLDWCHLQSLAYVIVPDRSLLVLPQIYRSMRISATLSCWTCRLLVGQHSTPYNMAGRIAVL
jgi:hypothetical protein